MLNDAYTYLIGKTNSIAQSFSETTQIDGECIVYRAVGSSPVSTLKGLKYHEYVFNVLVIGTEDSSYTCTLADNAFTALHMQTDVSMIQCTTPGYAYTDDNGRIAYTFNVTLVL